MSDEIKDTPSNGEQAKQGELYEWEKCTVRLSITFFPDDGDEGGRQVILGCNTHSDPPLIETVRESELGTLPPIIADLLERLKQRLPQQAEIAEAGRQAEIAAAEKARIQQQKANEKIKAAQQKYRVKNNENPQSSESPVEIADATPHLGSKLQHQPKSAIRLNRSTANNNHSSDEGGQAMALIKISTDGVEFELKDDIARDDQRLREALSPFYPELANAEITRSEQDGKLIVTMAKRAGTKGCGLPDVLAVLRHAPETINPAVVVQSKLRQMEERGELDLPKLLRM